jgi:peptidoglycan/LPS O-acetylase OafA/YrhL
VFFVLSGFVIAYVTDRGERSLADYALDRLSRLWSVALPALGFGMALSPFVSQSVFMPELAETNAALRTAANTVFMAQTWFLDLAPPLNGPFWSLNYEAWYYAIFGVWSYLPRTFRVPVAIFLSLIAGPKILLLMPCWLLGVLIYRTMQRRPLSEKTAVLLWICSFVAMALLIKSAIPTKIHNGFQLLSPQPAALLAYSGSPLTDYALAILVAVNFYATAHAYRSGRILLLPFAKPIRSMASFTLTTYLFHLPLLVLLWDVLHISPGVCLLALAGSIIAIGNLTEHRRRGLPSGACVYRRSPIRMAPPASRWNGLGRGAVQAQTNIWRHAAPTCRSHARARCAATSMISPTLSQTSSGSLMGTRLMHQLNGAPPEIWAGDGNERDNRGGLPPGAWPSLWLQLASH